MTGPELFAMAHGRPCSGDSRCTFCGTPASAPYALPDSFTARDSLAYPASKYACAGCLLCLEEAGTAAYHDDTTHAWTKAFRRMCSWVVTSAGATAATKAHLDYLRGVCLHPPDPPYLISLAVSGQRHVLYRSVVNHARGAAAVTLEGERVDYWPDQLAARLALCGRVAAATGKPALAEPPKPNLWFRVCARYSAGEAICEEWAAVRGDPLSRLAAFLCPAKEVCEREYPGDLAGDGFGGVPPGRGRVDRPEPRPDRRGRGRLPEGGGHPTLFGDV